MIKLIQLLKLSILALFLIGCEKIDQDIQSSSSVTILTGDVITMTWQYPGQLPNVLSGGAMLSGSPASSAASSGRKKSKAYQFGFGNKVGTGQ